MFHVVAVDMYISELMVVRNATLEATTILAILNKTDFQVTDSRGVSHTVTIEYNKMIAGMAALHVF